MRVASHSFFLIFLLYLTSCSAQVIPAGEYVSQSTDRMYTMKLQIQKNNRYVLTEYEDLVSIQSSGYYILDNAKLVLIKEKIDDNRGLGYLIDSSNVKDEGILILNISVFDKGNENIPFENAFLTINEKGKAILTFFTDEQGKHSVHIYDSTSDHFLKIGYFGYETVEVPLEKLMGKNIDLSVTLYPQEVVYDDVGKLYFEVIDFDDKYLNLKSGDGEIIEFKKQED